MIPQHCLDIFINRFGSYPSITEVHPPFASAMEKRIFGDKYHTIWYDRIVDKDGIKTDRKIFKEFDSSGIFFYINDEDVIFILSVNGKKDIVDYTIHELKK
jgi:hypothetical protein